MTGQIGIPKRALVAISDLLDSCANVQPGQEILLLAEVEGLHGGDSLVDQDAISWIQAAVQARGANASVLWIDEKPDVYAWRIPPVLKTAMAGCDTIINHSFNVSSTDLGSLREYIEEYRFERNLKYLRNFATTAPLLCSAWAQTPYELVSEIRYQASLAFEPGKPFRLTDSNGTHLEGIIGEPQPNRKIPGTNPYSGRRGSNRYYFWPEWAHKPVQMEKTNGVFIFDCMSSWWSRYIGISPYFDKPIELTVKGNRVTDIKGGNEANSLRRFLKYVSERLGDDVYNVRVFHSGVHPSASIAPHQCPNPLIRRLIEQSDSRNVHIHIGSRNAAPEFNFFLQHCTGDIRTPTLRVGDVIVHDRGHLTALDNPAVLSVAQKYPGRPGVAPEPGYS